MRIHSIVALLIFFINSNGYAGYSVIDFNLSTAAQNNITLQGAGFGAYPQAEVRFGAIPTHPSFPGATDGLGAIITAQPGEGVMFFAPPVDSALAALVRISVCASHEDAAITLATIDQGPDVFVNTSSPNNAKEFVGNYRRLVMLYTPASSGFQPVFQVFNNSKTLPLTVYVDHWESYTFQSGEYWNADFLSGGNAGRRGISLSESDLSVIPTPTNLPLSATPTPTPFRGDPVMLAEGKMLFENAHRGRNGNGFSCIICHDTGVDGESGIKRAGHTMMNAFNRPSWKNGNVNNLLEAVNTCLSDWMNADTLSEDDLLWDALETYIRSISPDPNSKPISIQIVSPPNPPTGGNYERGAAIIQSLACIDCHGRDLRGVMDEGGGLLAPYLVSRPEIPLDHEYITAKIRLSGSNQSGSYEDLTYGGNMPFWGANRISDQDVRDIAEYIAVASRWTPVPQDTATPTFTPTATPTPNPAQPTPTPVPAGIQPGWVADFGTGNAHRVGGKVRVLDEDTLQMENFQYDGGGIAVALYLIKATGQNFSSAEGRAGVTILNFTLGECYGLNSTCTDGNFTVDIPERFNLSDYTHISVWCVPVGVSFGHGRFLPSN